MTNVRLLPRTIVLAGVCLALLLVSALPPADARLDPKTWREVKSDAEQLFGQIGEREAKTRVIGLLLEDNDRRSWRLLVDGLVKEAKAWVEVATQIEEKVLQIDAVESKPMAKRYPEEQKNLVKWKEELNSIEIQAREQRAVLDDMTTAVAEGPEALRKNLFRTAKGAGSWPVRAAAARVAAMNPEEKLSFEYLSRAMAGDKDPRVRMAALEALRAYVAKEAEAGEEGVAPPEPGSEGEEEAAQDAPDILTTAEGLILGRLADEDWGVQLLAVRIVEEQKLTKAIPHLISALSFTGPRVREAIGKVLRDFTGENFDAYADVWSKWWEDNKEKFASEERVKAGKSDRPPSDMHFYGLAVKSDRILFIIDASSSMKLPTKNENPAEKWKPKGPVTGPGGPPPPPPPEEILSGPKIDVAKHELKKAIENLPESSLFNIIAFNSAVLRWQDSMMEASRKNKREALTWVRALEPKGSTYIDGALRFAFRLAGIGAIDQKYAVNVDTMVLLSDGAPTDDGYPDAKFMDPEIILDHVREWNQHQRIVIHCIGVDMVTSIEFLEKLAAENGGEYVDR